MNIKIFSIHNLLKLILIFNIYSAIVNSVSAQESATPQGQQETEQSKDSPQPTSNENPDRGTSEKYSNERNDDNSESEDSQSQPNQLNDNNPIPQIESSTPSSESKKTEQSTKSEDLTNSQKTLTIKDILLFIDLPILATLVLLWFLTQKKQQQQIDKITNNQNKIIGNFNQFNEINNKLNNLDKTNRQIIEKIQDNNQNVVNLNSRLPELLSKHQVNDSVTYHNNLTPDISHFSSIAIVDKIAQLIETYNQDKNSLSNKAITIVAETQESLNQRRSGNSNTLTLENTTQKKYCVIEEDNEHYLIPHAKINIEEHNRTTLESLFDCTNFTSEYSDFKLVKLAKVSQLSSEKWQLEAKGKLNFIKD